MDTSHFIFLKVDTVVSKGAYVLVVYHFSEAMESVMCDVIKIRLKGGNIHLFFRGLLSHFPFHPSFLEVFDDVTHDTFQCFHFYGILREKTMDDKLMYIQN